LFVIAHGISFQVLFTLVSWAFPDFKFSWLVKETKRNIPIELDFLNEGRNAEKVEKMFSHVPWLKVWHIQNYVRPNKSWITALNVLHPC